MFIRNISKESKKLTKKVKLLPLIRPVSGHIEFKYSVRQVILRQIQRKRIKN